MVMWQRAALVLGGILLCVAAFTPLVSYGSLPVPVMPAMTDRMLPKNAAWALVAAGVVGIIAGVAGNYILSAIASPAAAGAVALMAGAFWGATYQIYMNTPTSEPLWLMVAKDVGPAWGWLLAVGGLVLIVAGAIPLAQAGRAQAQAYEPWWEKRA